MSWSGLNQWAEEAGVRLGHPRIEIPTTGKQTGSEISITLDPKAADAPDPTGTGTWVLSGLRRVNWKMSEFAKAYPNEKDYLFEYVTAR
jgi:hypothetical protein